MEFFGLLYIAVLLIILLFVIIVVFHLRRYTPPEKKSWRLPLLFLMVTGILVIINVVFFLGIPFDSFMSTNAPRF